MSTPLSPTAITPSHSNVSSFFQEAKCGKLGFTIITVNLVALAIFAVNLASGGALLGAVTLCAAVIVLPSIALFGPSDYFHYLPQPLRMGLGFAAAWASVKVNANGAWEGKFADWAHFDDHRLAQTLPTFFKQKEIHSVLDCGCGTGFYVKQLQKEGMKEAYGCDGNPNTGTAEDPYLFVADLSKPHFLQHTKQAEKQFDCVMSLEVAEHLPKEHEDTFLDNLIGAVKEDGRILLSWAKKGQGGLGHVNEQDEEYVLQKMADKGWFCQEEETEQLRLNTSPNTYWFRETLYVFRKGSQIA